jgi:hypothetical protein
MYGVPEKNLDQIFAQQKNDPPPKTTVTNPDVVINGNHYVECTVEGVKLPSAYVNPNDGQKLTNNNLMTPVWQHVFGTQTSDVSQDPALANTPSFEPTEMKMKFYVRTFQKDDPQNPGQKVWATEMYGGGVNETWAGDDPAKQAYNERFLQAQMDAVKATMPGPG